MLGPKNESSQILLDFFLNFIGFYVIRFFRTTLYTLSICIIYLFFYSVKKDMHAESYAFRNFVMEQSFPFREERDFTLLMIIF